MAVICVNKSLPLYTILIGNKLDTGNCHQNADLQTGKQVLHGLSQCRTMDLLYLVPPSGPLTLEVSSSLYFYSTVIKYAKPYHQLSVKYCELKVGELFCTIIVLK